MKDQLNVRLDPKLVERVKSRAKAEKRTVGALVGIALGEWLEGASRQARDEEMALSYFTAQNANVDLAQQVQALTERLERLEQQRGEDIRTEGPKQKPRAKAAPAAKPSTIVPVDGAIPTDELARLLNIKRNTLNGRIRRAGGVAPGLMLEGWRCLGLVVPEGGGQAQALWQQA